MKLFTKYSRINVLFTLVIFLLASIAFSFLLRYVVLNQIDDDLAIEKNEVLTYVQKYQTLPAIIEVHDQYTSYQPVAGTVKQSDKICTRKIKDERDGDEEMVRTIVFGVAVNNQSYLVSVSKSLEGTDALIQSIIFITISTIILILAATFFINRLVLRRLWQPFYNTLQRIQQFKLADNAALSFTNSHIDEFDLLNTTLSKSINKAQQDYLVLKEFTENASHEMQTPLAVISSKLDVMIQSEDLTEPQSQAVQSSYDAINKLKKLNQSLLLLAKIENQQFNEKSKIDLEQTIVNKQKQFAEQYQNGSIKIDTNLLAATIDGNAHLVDILLNNLLSNAIRHNKQDGFVTIQLQPKQLQISNSGEPKPLDEQQIFNRFYKGNAASGQHGLGLSIVEQICEVSGYTCIYDFRSPDTHSFTITWS